MRWFSGNRIFGSETGDMNYTSLSNGVYSYLVPRNIAISRPKMCKKKLHNRYDFPPVTGGKIELSNNARGHPIACILPLDCLKKNTTPEF